MTAVFLDAGSRQITDEAVPGPKYMQLVEISARPEPQPVVTEGRLYQLDIDFAAGGAWAGISRLVREAYLDLRRRGETETLEEHEYELFMALPGLRADIRPKHLCLTDKAIGIERTRFYPVERAYRVIHGLVGLILQWKRVTDHEGRWTILVTNAHRAQHLAARFIGELARRGGHEQMIDVVIRTDNDNPGVVAATPGLRAIPVESRLAHAASEPVRQAVMDQGEASALDRMIVAGGEAALEENFAPLLAYYESIGAKLAAAQLAFKAMVVYNRRGYYHEAKSLLPTILPCFDQLVADDQARRMGSVSEINSCLVATGDGDRALEIVAALAVPHITKPHLLANMNYILAMHHLRYLEAKDLDRAEYFLLQSAENLRMAKGSSEADEHPFLTAFIDNGLAFLRVRQKRHNEALELCRSAYHFVTAALGTDRHLLHRSVLQYNMAQVYVMLGRLPEALACYETAISMDPFYAEYHAECGNIYEQLGRDGDAIASYEKALTCSPPYPEVYLRKAICHARREEWLDALACSGISLEISPGQPELHAARADMLVQLGRPDAALVEFDRAILLGDDSIPVRVNRAVLLFESQAYDLALADMDEVVAREPTNAAHYENRAAVYRAMGREDLSQRDLASAQRCSETA